MTRIGAALGSGAWLVVAPGTVCGVVPWLITSWHRPESPALLDAGAWGLLLVGGAVLLHAFVGFVWHGRGTPAPAAPTVHLVVRGAFRFVRNPMYVAVFAVVLGQVILFQSWALFAYLLVIAGLTHLFVRGYEEPTLRHRYGDAYVRYQAAVPRWLPRLAPHDGHDREAVS